MHSWRLWTTRHVGLLAYALGALLISAWTILRFLTQRTIFDLVGQQVLAQQLLHGSIAGAGIGATNYIPKIFTLYMPMALLPGSPRLKLVILTVVINIATLILIGIILEKLLRIFGIQARGALYIAILWLAAVSGSVFWIQFTNSRNLEVVGGLFLLYESLCYLEHPSRKRLIGIFLLGSILFFADTLQVYMTAVPLILYGVTICGRSRWQRSTWLAAVLAVSFIASKLLFVGVAHILSIHFVQETNRLTLPSPHELLQGVAGLVKAAAGLYSGGVDAGQLRRLWNVFSLCVAVLGLAYGIWRRLLPQRLVLLVGYILTIDAAVYIFSGQAVQPDTERYLIMTVPVVMLLFGAAQKVWQQFRSPGLVLVVVFLFVNSLPLSTALVRGTRLHFSQDAHLASVERYVRQHPNVLPYSSMDTAIPASYLSGSDIKAPLPLRCSDVTLYKDTLFYSQTAFRKREAGKYILTGIILDGTMIQNVPNICDKAQIVAQLGSPLKITTTDDGSTVLLYGKDITRILRY